MKGIALAFVIGVVLGAALVAAAVGRYEFQVCGQGNCLTMRHDRWTGTTRISRFGGAWEDLRVE